MKETRIYVGLNDAVTMEQKHDTEKYASVLRNVCKSYHVPFSFHLMDGMMEVHFIYNRLE